MPEEGISSDNQPFRIEKDENGHVVIIYPKKEGEEKEKQLVIVGLSEEAIDGIKRAKKRRAITNRSEFIAAAKEYIKI